MLNTSTEPMCGHSQALLGSMYSFHIFVGPPRSSGGIFNGLRKVHSTMVSNEEEYATVGVIISTGLKNRLDLPIVGFFFPAFKVTARSKTLFKSSGGIHRVGQK